MYVCMFQMHIIYDHIPNCVVGEGSRNQQCSSKKCVSSNWYVMSCDDDMCYV